MATNVSLNGNVYSIPAVGEDNWGQNLTDYFIAIPNAVLQKNGGNFTLLADVNFGATYGVLAKYFSGRTLPALSGLFRAGNTDTLAWRNFANSGDLSLGVNSSDQLTFNGGVLYTGGITSLTGDVTASGPGAAVATIANGAVTFNKLAPLTSGNILVGDGTNTAASVALSGDATLANTGALTIANNVVTNAKLAQVATATFKGRTTAGTGNVEDLSATQATALLDNFVGDSGSGGTKGLVPAPAAGDAAALKFLKADGTWAVASGGGSSVVSFTLANNQSSPADVTGFLVSPASDHAFTSDISIERVYSALLDGTLNADFAAAATFGSGTPSAILVQSDGAILPLGASIIYNGQTVSGGVYRIFKDGSIDQGFQTNFLQGITQGGVRCGALQSDGKILVGGSISGVNGDTRAGLIRLNADGSEDTAFSTSLGTGFTGGGADLYCIFVQGDGKILVTGDFTAVNGTSATNIARLNSDGTVDTAFCGNTGSGFNSIPYSIIQQSTGKILVGGSFTTFNGNSRNFTVGLNSDGTEYATYYTTVNASGGFNAAIRKILEQASGKILVGGEFTTYQGVARGGLIQLSAAYALDATFATNSGSGANSNVRSLASDSSNNVYVGGLFTQFNGNARAKLVKLSSAGVEDATWYANRSPFVFGDTFDLQMSVDQVLVTMSVNSTKYVNEVGYFASTLLQVSKFGGFYNGSAWSVGYLGSVGSDCGVDFSMTALGQLQYTSSNLHGTGSVSRMKFTLVGL